MVKPLSKPSCKQGQKKRKRKRVKPLHHAQKKAQKEIVQKRFCPRGRGGERNLIRILEANERLKNRSLQLAQLGEEWSEELKYSKALDGKPQMEIYVPRKNCN